MEPQEQPVAPAVVNDYKREVYIREAKRLIGEISAIRAKSNADISKQTADPDFRPHGSNTRVWGNTLKGAYGDVRTQAHSLKQLFVTELGIHDDYVTLEYPFQQATGEELGENQAKMSEAIGALERLIGLAYYSPPVTSAA